MPPKSFTFTLRDRGGVSQLTGRKEDIRKRVVPERFFASTARFAVVRVRGLPCDVERLTLGELVLPVSDDWCFAEFHVTSKRCTSGSSAFRKWFGRQVTAVHPPVLVSDKTHNTLQFPLRLQNLVSTS